MSQRNLTRLTFVSALALMGGGTTKVGDPSGRDESRKLLTDEIIASTAPPMQMTATSADSTLARIARMVQEAAASRGATQRFIERFSAIWTPAAMLVA